MERVSASLIEEIRSALVERYNRDPRDSAND